MYWFQSFFFPLYKPWKNNVISLDAIDLMLPYFPLAQRSGYKCPQIPGRGQHEGHAAEVAVLQDHLDRGHAVDTTCKCAPCFLRRKRMQASLLDKFSGFHLVFAGERTNWQSINHLRRQVVRFTAKQFVNYEPFYDSCKNVTLLLVLCLRFCGNRKERKESIFFRPLSDAVNEGSALAIEMT